MSRPPELTDAARGTAMALLKQALADGDAGPLRAFLTATLRETPGAARGFAALLAAERARLVKLRSLGQTTDFERKVGLTDALMKGLETGGDA